MIWADGQEWGTASHLAARFGVTVWTIYKWRRRHGLTVHRIGGVDYSPVVQAALIDRDRRDATRGTPRLDVAAA